MVLKTSGQLEMACLPDKQEAGLSRNNHDFICKSKRDPL